MQQNISTVFNNKEESQLIVIIKNNYFIENYFKPIFLYSS